MGELLDQLRARRAQMSSQGSMADQLRAQRDSVDPRKARIDAARAGTLQVQDPDRQAAIDRAAEIDLLTTMKAQEMQPKYGMAASYLQGIPFIGEYVDETIQDPIQREVLRKLQSGFEEDSPVLAGGTKMASGVINSIPAVAAAGPGVVAGLGTSLLARTGIGAGLGALMGGVEGAVSGYGAGNDGDRAATATQRGVIGAGLGGVLGGLAPSVVSAVKSGFERFGSRGAMQAAREAGIDDETARVLSLALEGDAGSTAARKAVPDAMVADTGPNAMALLDFAVQKSGPGATQARDAVRDRASRAGARFTDSLDQSLGPVRGVNEVQREVMQRSAGARSAAYDAAYAAPIDYSAKRGVELEGMLQRVPPGVINRANELMRTEGVTSPQIKALVDDAGNISMESLPDVRQWDYISRALRDVSSAANRAGDATRGNVFRGLEKDIKTNLDELVPEFGQARAVAGDAISQREAVQTGRNLFTTKSTREDIAEEISGASPAELARMREGARGFLDDQMGRVKAIMSDPSQDSREAAAGFKLLSSTENRDKMRLLLGDAADSIFDEMDNLQAALSLRARVAENSKTFIRQEGQRTLDAITDPGVMGELRQGSPLQAAQRLVQSVSGGTKEESLRRQREVMSKLANVLTSPDAQGAQARNFAGINPRLAEVAAQGQIAADRTQKAITSGSMGALVGARSDPVALRPKAEARIRDLQVQGVPESEIRDILAREGLL